MKSGPRLRRVKPLRRGEALRSSSRHRRQRPLRAQRATPGSTYKTKATYLHSLLVRHRARGLCERCGEKRPLECAHIVSRRYAATRTVEANGWGLCRPCHRIVDTDTGEHAHLVMRTIGSMMYEALRGKALLGVKADEVFWRGEYDRLLPRARALGLA